MYPLYDYYRQLYLIEGFVRDLIIKKIGNHYIALYYIDYTNDKFYPIEDVGCLPDNVFYNYNITKLMIKQKKIRKIVGQNAVINYKKCCDIYNLNYNILTKKYKLKLETLFLDKETYFTKYIFNPLFTFYQINLITDVRNIIIHFYLQLTE